MKRKRANPADVPWCIVVHAGAGQHSRAREGKYCAMMQRACEVGRDALLRGGGSTAAVEAAVAVLEDDPAANAGLGSNLTIEGTVECDASVMEGAERTFGACGAVAGVRNPIALAARVLRQQQGRALSLGRVHPVMLVSDGARRWAEAHDVPVCPAAALVTPEARARWEGYRRALCPSEQGKGEGEGEGLDLGLDLGLGLGLRLRLRLRLRLGLGLDLPRMVAAAPEAETTSTLLIESTRSPSG